MAWGAKIIFEAVGRPNKIQHLLYRARKRTGEIGIQKSGLSWSKGNEIRRRKGWWRVDQIDNKTYMKNEVLFIQVASSTELVLTHVK